MTTEAPTVILLDPSTVQVNPKNARKKLRDIDQLAKSMERSGVLVPVLVRSVDGNGTYMLVAGERRRAAAIKAKVQLPAIVTDNPEAAEEALWMLTENENRDALNTTERAAAYQTAMDLGVAPDVVREYTGISAEEQVTLTAISASRVATLAAERRNLTLEEAALVAEFDDDKEAVKQLLEMQAEGRMLPWRIETLRRERAERKALAEKLQPYLDEGVRVLTPADIAQTSTNWDKRAHTRTPIAFLLTDKGKSLTPAGHKKCPGRTVGIFRWDYGNAKVTEFCEEPDKHGHTHRKAERAGSAAVGGKEPTAKELEKAKEERRKVRENNKAMDVANTVRPEFLRELVGRKTIPKGTERFIARVLMTTWLRPDVSTAAFAEVTGRPKGESFDTTIDALPESRAIMALLAWVATAIEGQIDKTAWRNPTAQVQMYLRFLESCGYALSDVESETIK